LKKSPDSPAATITPVDDNTKDKGRFLVSGVLGFDTVPGLMKQAKRLFASCDSVVIDFSAVENCNSAGLAVVLEIARQMQQQNKSVCFESLPEQIYTFARAYSIEKELSRSGLLC
jgi:ABC-type transporter Mla MlaB component